MSRLYPSFYVLCVFLRVDVVLGFASCAPLTHRLDHTLMKVITIFCEREYQQNENESVISRSPQVTIFKTIQRVSLQLHSYIAEISENIVNDSLQMLTQTIHFLER